MCNYLDYFTITSKCVNTFLTIHTFPLISTDITTSSITVRNNPAPSDAKDNKMKEGEKVLEVEPGHANEAVEKPDANAKDDEMKVRELAVALKPATVKENEVAEDPEADIKITDGEKSVEMEPTSASVKVNDEAVEKADGKAKNNEMKAREAAVALEPASVKKMK